MDQRFEGTPQAEIRLDGRRLSRSRVTNDWGSQLVWEIRRNGQVISQTPARTSSEYTHEDNTPGQYEAVLKMFKYEGYAKDAAGEFTQSKFVEVSNKIAYTV